MTSSNLMPLTLLVVAVTFTSVSYGRNRFSWMGYDQFDEINARISSVDATNCRSKSKEEMILPKDVVSQLPVYNQLLSRIWYRNRTSLIHIHNMALNRAFFFSYVLQRMNETTNYNKQPGWLYYYCSASADVNANPNMLNASAVYFDQDCHYPNWYTTVSFNHTIPLFGTKAFRWDNYKDQGNFLREPNRRTVRVQDIGAGTNRNYSRTTFKMNNWYTRWLPDIAGDMDSLTKFTYYIGIKMSNQTGRFTTNSYEPYSFFGPNSPSADDKDSRKLPVIFTEPYFDCGVSNKWVVSAVSPVVDYMPRYSNFTHMRRQRFVAVVAMDTDFEEIDFNACGVSSGNPGPSYLSGIDRCKATTSCKHTMGQGFKRGGYVCVCKSGRKYPWWLIPPFRGSDIEQATDTEYKYGFTCTPTDYRLVLPVIDSTAVVDPDIANKKKRGAYRNESDDGIAGNAKDSLTFKSEDQEEAEDQSKHIKQLTSEQMLGLADALRTLKPEALKSLPPELFTDTKSTPRQVELDYLNKNDVDVTIELDYEEEIKSHEKYKTHLSRTKIGQNMTHLRQAVQDNLMSIRDRHMERFHSDRGNLASKRRRKRAAIFDQQAYERVTRIFRQKGSVNKKNCHTLPSHQLYLQGDVAFGVETQFEAEGRTALRLAHFLSAYLQISEPDDNFGNLRGGGRLHIDQMYGEVIANVMGNYKILSSGIFFDRHKFENQDGSVRELFGPWAYRSQNNYFAHDAAGLSHAYVDEDWFRQAKSRFGTSFSGLSTYLMRSHIRSDPEGSSNIKFEYFPLKYRTAPYKAGFWTRPYFRCDGNVDNWVMTYVTPFFGFDPLKTRLDFRGVVTVDVPLDLLEIDQCPQPFSVANAFKNTARCDYFSTNCRAQEGFPFRIGAYACRCRVGFEYWHYDGKEWFEGSFVEGEYLKKINGLFSRFDNLYCRPAAASLLTSSLIKIFSLACLSFFYNL